MKVLLLSDINSSHTQKWAIALSDKGIDSSIFSLSEATNDWFSEKGIKVYSGNIDKTKHRAKNLSKLSYFKVLGYLKSIIKKVDPDIVHAHYATSYGMLGALTKHKPFIISVWGSDVFDFPNKSFAHRIFLKYALKKASLILSTSHIMAKETAKYTSKKIEVIPFGIDTNIFKPKPNESSEITIGTIKSFEPIYGIEFLINAFKKITVKHPNLPLKLMLVGSGSLENKFKKLVTKLEIDALTTFTGKVPHSKVVEYHNTIDIFVNVSIHESFGVSVIEASACEKPVIASNIGGLAEVVDNDNTGILVSHSNTQELVNAIDRLILNEQKRVEMGKAGRKKVMELYNLNKNTEDLYTLYRQLKG